MFSQGKKLAIYVAEREEMPQRGGDGVAYHTFLLLIDESTKPVSILQQLHYTDAEDPRTKELYLLPNARMGISCDRLLDRVRAYPLIGGKEPEIMEMWNYALSYASYVKVMKPEFSMDYDVNIEAVNCRAGVVATLRALDLEFDAKLYSRNAGVGCRSLPEGVPYKHNQQGVVKRRTLADLWQANVGLRFTLDASWIPEDRYIGPLKRPFRLMDPDANICDQSFE